MVLQHPNFNIKEERGRIIASHNGVVVAYKEGEFVFNSWYDDAPIQEILKCEEKNKPCFSGNYKPVLILEWSIPDHTLINSLGGNLKIPLASENSAGLFSSGNFHKLSTIEYDANKTDNDFILNRENHTNTQLLNTISDAGTAASKDVTGTGNLIFSGFGGVAGNIFEYDSNGDLIDAGIPANNLVTLDKNQTLTSKTINYTDNSITIELSNVIDSGEAAAKNITGTQDFDVITGLPGNVGNLVEADDFGNLVDTGYKVEDFVTPNSFDVLKNKTIRSSENTLEILQSNIIDAGTLASLNLITNSHVDTNAGIELSKLSLNPIDRQNHTGTQLLNTISDSGEAAAKDITGIENLVVSGVSGFQDNFLIWNNNGDAIDSGISKSYVLSLLSNVVGDTSPTLGGDLDGDQYEISNFKRKVITKTSTNETLLLEESESIIEFNNSSEITLNLPDTFPKGWSTTIVQANQGCINFNGTNTKGIIKTNGMWATAFLYVRENSNGNSAVYVLDGGGGNILLEQC